ncbi:MAG TPA: hypothetical protein VIM84_03665 [Gemmatimonadales bacterium]
MTHPSAGHPALLPDSMDRADRNRNTALLGEWANKLDPSALDLRTTSYQTMERSLQALYREGFIEEGWRLEWDHRHREWRTHFTVRGGARRDLLSSSYSVYMDGWTDRRAALIHRYR